MPRRAEVDLIYVTGLVQGLALVTFPAASFTFMCSTIREPAGRE